MRLIIFCISLHDLKDTIEKDAFIHFYNFIIEFSYSSAYLSLLRILHSIIKDVHNNICCCKIAFMNISKLAIGVIDFQIASLHKRCIVISLDYLNCKVLFILQFSIQDLTDDQSSEHYYHYLHNFAYVHLMRIVGVQATLSFMYIWIEMEVSSCGCWAVVLHTRIIVTSYMHTFTYSMGELFLESRVVEWSLVRVHNRTLYLTFAYIWIFPVINLSLVEDNFTYDNIKYHNIY